MADNLLELDRPEEAAAALERALKYVEEPEKNLQIVTRLCEVFTRHLEQPERAVEALRRYLKKYPNTSYAASLQSRIDSAFQQSEYAVPEGLASLDELPVEEVVVVEVAVRETQHLALDSLEEQPMAADPEPYPEPEQFAAVRGDSPRIALSSLDDLPLEEVEDEPVASGERMKFSLQAMDDAPVESADEGRPA